jgi:uncharacterized protein with GYD domain
VPIYVSLIKWTDQGRAKVDSLPDRVEQVNKRVADVGGKVVANYVTMGRFDQIAITEAPDDETAVKLLLIVAGRGNAITETLRAWTMEEARGLVSS